MITEYATKKRSLTWRFQMLRRLQWGTDPPCTPSGCSDRNTTYIHAKEDEDEEEEGWRDGGREGRREGRRGKRSTVGRSHNHLTCGCSLDHCYQHQRRHRTHPRSWKHQSESKKREGKKTREKEAQHSFDCWGRRGLGRHRESPLRQR